MTTESFKKAEKIRKEKRNLYLMSAISVFEEKGFNDGSVKDITEKAGTSVGNFYRYFDSKEEIFENIIHQFYELMISKLNELNKEPIPRIGSIKKLFKSYIKLFKEKKNIALIYIEQMGGINKKYKDMKNEYNENFAKEVEKIIQRLVDLRVSRIQNVQITARVWTSALLEIFLWWIRSDFALSEQELIDNITDFLVLGTMTKKQN